MMMIEAFANHISSHLGRHMFYWATAQGNDSKAGNNRQRQYPLYHNNNEDYNNYYGNNSDEDAAMDEDDDDDDTSIDDDGGGGIKLGFGHLINKVHVPLERGIQVLDNLLTLEEDDFTGHWGIAHAHHFEPEYVRNRHSNNDNGNLFRGNQQIVGGGVMADALIRIRPVETLNNGNGLLLSPLHNNSTAGHQQQNQHQRAHSSSSGSSTTAGGGGSGASTSGSGGTSTTTAEHNIQITQPVSAPSSPLASPGALTSPTTFCLPTSSSTAGGVGILASVAIATTTGSGSYICSGGGGGGGGGAAAASGTCGSSAAAATNAAACDTADPNWQASKATVLERNAAMFNNELMSDVKFAVGGDFDTVQTIPAHKYILATGSSVFYAMFYGGLAENKQEIKVPDVEPTAFLTLLRYLYCDEIQLEPDNILATLYAAKKYIVPHLARACVNYLEVKLTAKNACLLLSQSRLFEEPELMQRCWEVIDAQAEMAIKSEDFVDIDLKTFESILSRETLNCKEIHLFEAALNWALNACQKMSIDVTAQNKRSVLGQALHLIRIPTMSLEEFANGVAQTGILTSQETIDIFLHFTAKAKPIMNYPIRARAGLKTQVCHRFQSCAYRSNQWRYRGRCDSIQFSVDRRIFIVGFGLYGSSTGAANYNVKIELKRLGRTLAENDTKFFSDGSSNTFHVFFENPIQVEPECYYTASVILDGNELSFFGQEGMSEVCMGNVTFQFQCSSESTNGTGVQGGQIPELIFYGPTSMTPMLHSSTNSLCPTPIGNAGPGGSGAVIFGNLSELLGSSGSGAGDTGDGGTSA